MDNRAELKVLVKSGKDLLFDQRFHLERNAGHRNENFAVPIKPHARSRAAAVGQYGATFRNVGLSLIQLIEIDVPLGGHPFHLFENLLVADQTHAEHSCERMFGNIVLCRAESTGAEHDVGAAQGLVYRLGDVFGRVRYRGNLVDADSGGVQLLA